jgi:hypothetical protein
VQHSFGEDATHNLCCALGREARAYADASGNPIGALAESIDTDNDLRLSNWSTCMGSNVCSEYASRFDDGTRPLFATDEALTQVVTNVPPDPDCEAFAAELLSTRAHGTPGISTRGHAASCKHKAAVRRAHLKRHRDVDRWLQHVLRPPARPAGDA